MVIFELAFNRALSFIIFEGALLNILVTLNSRRDYMPRKAREIISSG